MLQWRGDYFENLRRFASLARENPEWSDYASFCEKYEQGLRQEAFGSLERFIEYLEKSPFSERRKFVSWLLPRVDGIEGKHMLAPFPLSNRIIRPTLCEWTVAEPGCAEPHLWLGDYDNLKQAFALKPDDDVIRRKLVACILNRVDWSTHELMGTRRYQPGCHPSADGAFVRCDDPAIYRGDSYCVRSRRIFLQDWQSNCSFGKYGK